MTIGTMVAGIGAAVMGALLRGAEADLRDARDEAASLRGRLAESRRLLEVERAARVAALQVLDDIDAGECPAWLGTHGPALREAWAALSHRDEDEILQHAQALARGTSWPAEHADAQASTRREGSSRPPPTPEQPTQVVNTAAAERALQTILTWNRDGSLDEEVALLRDVVAQRDQLAAHMARVIAPTLAVVTRDEGVHRTYVNGDEDAARQTRPLGGAR